MINMEDGSFWLGSYFVDRRTIIPKQIWYIPHCNIGEEYEDVQNEIAMLERCKHVSNGQRINVTRRRDSVLDYFVGQHRRLFWQLHQE
jgi:hypothetical protein